MASVSLFHRDPSFLSTFLQISLAPFSDLGKDRKQRFPLFCQGIFHMRRNLVKLLAVDNTIILQISERRSEHGICDPGYGFLQFSKSAGGFPAQLIDDMGTPLAAQELQGAPHRAVILHIAVHDPVEIFYCGEILFHPCLRYVSPY